MITGVVQSDEGRIRLTVKGSRGRNGEVVAIIDTGYTGTLTLPPDLVEELALRWQTVNRVTLADGSESVFRIFEAKVVWGGKSRRILVDETDADPLVGKGHARALDAPANRDYNPIVDLSFAWSRRSRPERVRKGIRCQACLSIR